MCGCRPSKTDVAKAACDPCTYWMLYINALDTSRPAGIFRQGKFIRCRLVSTGGARLLSLLAQIGHKPMFEQAFKNIDDVLRKEAGCTTELDYTEQHLVAPFP